MAKIVHGGNGRSPKRKIVPFDTRFQERNTGRDEENAMIAELTARGENPAEASLPGHGDSLVSTPGKISLEEARTDHDPFDVPSARDTEQGVYSQTEGNETLEVLYPLPAVVHDPIEAPEGDGPSYVVSFPATPVVVESSPDSEYNTPVVSPVPPLVEAAYLREPVSPPPRSLEASSRPHSLKKTGTWKDSLSNFLYGVGTVGAIGLGAFILTERFYPQGPEMISAFFVHDKDKKEEDQPAYLPIGSETHTVNQHYPLIPSEDENKEFVKQATVTPLPGMGLYSVAAFLSENDAESMSVQEQKDALKKYRKLTGKQVRGLHDLVVELVEANKDHIYNVDTSDVGLKDSKKNIIYADVPLHIPVSTNAVLKLPEVETEEKLFAYEKREGQDAVVIHFKLNGPGVSQYIAPLEESGWNAAQMQTLADMSFEEQAARVKKSGRGYIHSLPKEDVHSILDETVETIEYEANKGIVQRVDTTHAGLKDGEKNIIYREARLVVPVQTPIRNAPLENIINDNFTNEKLPGLGTIVREYFELKNIGEDVPSVKEEADFATDELVLNIARRYNNEAAEASDFAPYSKENRLELAGALYRKTADRTHRETYMTVDEIVDLVNVNTEETITAEDIRGTAGISRKVIRDSLLFERRNEIWKDYQYFGLGREKKSFVDEQVEKYNLSPSTVYNDLRLMNGIMGTEVPEPKYIPASQ